LSTLKTMYAAQVNSPYTTTLGEISASDTAVVVADASVLLTTLPYLLTFGYDKSASETVLVTAVSGNTLTITRGVDGNALLWVAGTKVARIFTAKDLNDVQENIRTLNSGKQENLTFDTTPTADSTNPVTSGGIKAALNLKANSATLASHTGNTSNPHGVTAAQVGATTPEQVDTAIREVCDIGDMKTTVATPSENWLPCDGGPVYAADYPDLVNMLQTANPQVTSARIAENSSIYYRQSSYITYRPKSTGAWYYNGRWVVATPGYKNVSSSSSGSGDMNTPVIYTTTDVRGSWTEVRLSTENYWLAGVCYDKSWGYWVAYGHKIVSDTECNPYFFYTSNPEGTWTARKISSTNCKVACGHYADGQLVILAKGCGEDNDGYAYAYVAGNYVSFTENNFDSGLGAFSYGLRGLYYGGGYWGYVDNQGSVCYATDPSGTWTKNTLVSSGVQLRDLCYGNGVWCAVGMQNSGGSGRLFYSSDITGKFTDIGITDVNYCNEIVGFCDGVFVTLQLDLGSARYMFVSTDNCKTWTKKELGLSTIYDVHAFGGTWVVPGGYGVSLLFYPEADAITPKLDPAVGKTYIRAL